MNQSQDLRILQPAHKDAVLAFATRMLATRIEDPADRQIAGWNARWRPEALDHYLALGWSFGSFRGEELTGFILGQPFLFFRGLTQTLWLESVEAVDHATRELLIDCAQKWARDKHMQCALIESEDGTWREIKTARFTT